ncbi:MAG TPA: hypothetical protein VHT23_05135 [Gemmatimonadaceae bacterium]|nr:hypothetical protein [Gemmatimonadaceae bacterium]
MSVSHLFEKLRAALDATEIPYFVTGSFASSAHGVPRSTNDIDIIIAPTPTQLNALMDRFSDPEYYSDREDALEALERRSQFNVIDNETLWKIDFIVSKDSPFDRARFQRRRTTEIAGVNVSAATPEDVVIAKLLWSKLGESERQINDAAGVVRMQSEKLDIPYIESWVDALELGEQWGKARERAG